MARSPSRGDDSFQEGLYIDYRHFDKAGITPRFEFGFGLCKFSSSKILLLLLLPRWNEAEPMSKSHITNRLPLAYTNFTYSTISVTNTAKSGPATGEIQSGGRSDLWDTVATVTCTITNSGPVTGAEVPQLYITLPSGAPAAPPKQLRGFQKLSLTAGASGTATFNLRRRDLSYWDVKTQNWIVPSGSFGVSVGASSRDIRLTGKLDIS